MEGQNAPKKLRVAIIGAGPAGLGAAIEFQKLSFVDFRIYDQATVLREVGTGISLQPNTWRLLDLLDASRNISPDEIFRPNDQHSVQHRNGRTGELIVSHGPRATVANHLHARCFRSVLQKALLSIVDKSRLRLSSRLVKVVESASKTLSLHFEDGFVDEVDLLIGADGVRSVVRKFAFPDHKISYIGRTAYRAILPAEDILSIPNFPDAVTFWHGPTDWVYTCNLNGGKYEITVNAVEPADNARVSWGEKATLEEFRRPWKDFGPTVQAVINKVTDVQKFALFAGPRLDTVVARGAIALVGDASHPLSGAFGNGAGFALEDSYALTRSVSWAQLRGHSLKDALDLYDRVRSPHYHELYKILDEFSASDAVQKENNLSFDEAVAHTISGKWGAEYTWLYDYNIQDVWTKAAEAEDTDRLSRDTRHNVERVSHLYTVSVVAFTAFCLPGMFGALNGLGAAGEETATLSNIANAVVFGVMTVGGFFSGIICNRIGVRGTLVIGTFGPTLLAHANSFDRSLVSIASLYTNAAFGNTSNLGSWFPVFGAVTCGISAVFLWTASGAINLVVPAINHRGRAVATKFTLQNLGSAIGGMISLGLNAHGDYRGRVSNATYFTFTSIMCLALPLAATIPLPSQVRRSDGSRVIQHKFNSYQDEVKNLKKVLSLKVFFLIVPFLIYYQWDLSYMWNWNAAYHTVRARALLSTLFYLVGPAIIGQVQGWLLDKKEWSRPKRARWGVTLFTIVTALVWIYGLVVQYQYDKQEKVIDITDAVFVKSCLLFILYGLIENSGMVIAYWIIGSLGLEPGQVSSFVGLANGLGGLGSTLAFVLGAVNVSLTWQLWANVITFLSSIPGLLYIGWFMVVDDNVIQRATTIAVTSTSIAESSASSGHEHEQYVYCAKDYGSLGNV
ncbi:UNC93-like protein C922,05c [Talaromyces islandicus]|uniref:UNC93-like protein C922,05c n=1 Tax=Talaromyces islandicus TaxID=28573 RepID=A0A0U1M025_TALIS|nr:UNC93-like protein C922,05c [Talaromyces islandicus]